MPRRSAEPRTAQLLLRLTQDEFDLLDSAAHLHRTTPNAYVYDLVHAHVAVLRTDPHVLADRRNVESFEEQHATTVDLRDGRRRKAEGEGSISPESGESSSTPS